MKKVVCVVDNHLHLEYGKTYEVVSERDLQYKVSRPFQGSSFSEIYWWDKSFFVSLEEFRNEKIERIVE